MASGKHVQVKTTVSAALSDGANEIAALAEEMGSWRDGMEEKLSHTDKYQAVSDACDTLENSDIESLVDTLTTALDDAENGEDAKAGCPTHVLGTPCAVCGWKGTIRQLREIQRFDVPKQIFGGDMCIGRIGSQYFTDVASFDAEVKKFETLPSERKATPAIEPLFGMNVGEREIEVSEFKPYKGKSASRATRCSDAVGMMREACEAIESALSELESDLPPGATDEETEAHEAKQERIDELRSNVEEVTSALDEIEGVEFPGMYG